MRNTAKYSSSYVYILRLLEAAEQYLLSVNFAMSRVIVADSAGESYELPTLLDRGSRNSRCPGVDYMSMQW